uniref:Uncharacterized protein n=1 Tax=Pavo cristatus TaxID=9049 RepID=A0A8C9F6X5_PAVCR
MRSAALRFCPVLLLLFANLHLGSAAAVKKRADKSDFLVPDPYSRKCPMGTYLANDSVSCVPCKKDEYTEYPNDFPKCLGCRTCREDQVQVSPCIPTRNTQCACKNGTFCSPDHPCEMCQKCQTRCPKGQVRIAPCTQHSDLQCGPPLDDNSSFSTGVIIVTVLLAVIVVLLLVFCWRICCCRHHGAGDGGELSGKPSAVVGMARRTSNPSVETQKKLVPVPEGDPIALLRRSFNTFVDCVPFPEWKRFGRALDLEENDLYLAEQQDRVSLEPFYHMLNTWLHKQGSKASVNTLLETLSQISLSGVADRIASELIRKGYFQYEVS